MQEEENLPAYSCLKALAHIFCSSFFAVDYVFPISCFAAPHLIRSSPSSYQLLIFYFLVVNLKVICLYSSQHRCGAHLKHSQLGYIQHVKTLRVRSVTAHISFVISVTPYLYHQFLGHVHSVIYSFP
jgi:hypothetical protein